MSSQISLERSEGTTFLFVTLSEAKEQHFPLPVTLNEVKSLNRMLVKISHRNYELEFLGIAPLFSKDASDLFQLFDKIE